MKPNNRISIALSGDNERKRLLYDMAKVSACPGVYTDLYKYTDDVDIIANVWDIDTGSTRMWFNTIAYHIIYLSEESESPPSARLERYLANRISDAKVVVVLTQPPAEHITEMCKSAGAQCLALKDRIRPFVSELLKIEYDNRVQAATERLLEACR